MTLTFSNARNPTESLYRKDEMQISSAGLLKDKVALVTGGARGIGAAIAKRFGEEGAAVAITYAASKESAETVATAIRDAGGRALAIHADNTEASQLIMAVRETVRVFERLDILVNNAGIARLGTISTYSTDDFDEMIAVNIRGLFVATQEAIRHMGEGGRVINIGSISNDYIPLAGNAIQGGSIPT